MSYKTMGYSIARRVLANLDKCSRNGDSNVVNSPWGVFTMYRVSKRGYRYYSVSKSDFFHGRGSLRIGTIRKMLFGL